MIELLRRVKPLSRTAMLFFSVAGLTAAGSAHAQFYKLHNADVAVGGTGLFTTPLNSDAVTASGTDYQYTTGSAGVIGSLQDHPVSWAGVEVNYGYSRFSERYNYVEPYSTDRFEVGVPTGMHEATGAYMFHLNIFHLQPFVNIGGGGLYFNPVAAPAQWRGAGLLEAGFDIPVNPHFGFRVQGRSLYYRAPNFNTPLISTRSWVVTEEPSLSAYMRF